MINNSLIRLTYEISNNQSVFITGAAGTGKTTLLKQIYDSLKADGKRIALTSTTGINAMNLGGITIHKFMGINIQTSESYIRQMKASFLFSAIKKRLAKFDIIAIDEVSMLRADQFELINRVLKEASGNDLPFGGKTMVFTGDFYQIPPVVRSYEKNQNQWLFTSKPWIKGDIKIYELCTIYRQSNPEFIEFLNNVRIGNFVGETTDSFINLCLKREPLNNDTRFFSTNDECDLYNQKKLEELDGPLVTYKAILTGKRKKQNKEAIIRECIAKETLYLKKNAAIITINNDKKERYFNGTKGEIVDLKDKEIVVKLENGEIINIKPFTWMKVNTYDKVIATMKQIPVLLRYALTIHKSQGMTLETAVIDCKNIFTYGQLYVAISRVRTIEGLTLVNFDKTKIISCPEVTNFYKTAKINKL